MQALRLFQFGKVRSIGVDDFPPGGTTILGGASEGQVADVYASVPWLARCAALRAYTLASIPCGVIDTAGNEVDHPLLGALSPILAEIEFSLCLFGAAYLLKLYQGRRVVDIQLLNPQTMAVVADPARGLVGFRQIVGERREYSPDDIVYIRLYNPSDDVGPGVAPAQVALEAAGLARAAIRYAQEFFDNGALPTVLLTTEQPVGDSEIERLRNWWNAMFRGEGKRHRTAVLQRGLKPEVISSPLKDLAIDPLMTLVRQQIAVAFGVPQTLIEDAANYATAREHRLSFYRETVFPEAELIASNLTAQLFAPYEFRFYTERVEAVQQEEASKAQALVQLVQTGIMTVNEAREALGLPVAQPADVPVDESEVEPVEEPVRAVGGMTAPPLRGLSDATKRDLARWRRKALRGDTQFVSGVIPAWVRAAIEARLGAGQDADAAFGPFLRAFDKDRAETKLATRVGDVLRDVADKAARKVGSEDNEWVDEVLDAADKALQSALAVELTAILVDVALDVGAGMGIPLDYDDILTEAAAWARDYTYSLVKGITDTSRARLQDIISRIVNGTLTKEDAVTLLSQIFGPVRAQMIATTEVTRAMAQATNLYQRLARERGYEVHRRWLTAEDEKVCEICGPLDHKLEEVWMAEFPDGPPAHVNCRCQIVVEWAKR